MNPIYLRVEMKMKEELVVPPKKPSFTRYKVVVSDCIGAEIYVAGTKVAAKQQLEKLMLGTVFILSKYQKRTVKKEYHGVVFELAVVDESVIQAPPGRRHTYMMCALVCVD